MQPVKQTQFAAPIKDGDRWILPPDIGNCFASCVASILEMPLADVPNFCAIEGDWWKPFQYWLFMRGLYAVEVVCNYEQHYLWPLPPDVLCIVTGKSPRGDFSHAVVARTVAGETGDGEYNHGFEYVHDPHPSNAYVEKPKSILFFAALAPEQVASRKEAAQR